MTTVTPTTQSGAISKERFERLARDWKARSRYLSNPAQMAMLPEYQRIIGMGAAAIPLILEELRSEPNQWFWALTAITDENPVEPTSAGDVTRMAQAWLDWGLRKGIIAA
jgi:hypothetical protein